ncbi:zinc finger protein 501-like [Bradysia coprophila]|uniref:zinc finger protein 501-like n=1 Tax=Bradysia coprophila TaxID=38358 RepID=UPI00187DAB77|nr:zinc finger protein 501-like [Bradysia coprophila]
MDSICRLCCTYYDVPKMENLFAGKNKHLLDKLHYFACFTFRIDVNDGFPPYICIPCTELLQAAYEFKMICESAEANFWALSQSNITMQTEVKYQIELEDCERDCTLKDLEVEFDSNATGKTTTNGDNEFEVLFTDGSDDSGEEKPNKSDLNIHTNVIGTNQSAIPIHIEMRKICTKATGSTCDTCGELFRRKRDLKRHIKEAHQSKIVREKSWICESCGKNFCSQFALKYHISGTHVDTVDKNYSCDLCDFKCRQARYLVSHTLKHTGAKPHRCKECGQAFGFQGSLNRHIQAVHRNAKPHQCTICDRYFKNKVQLREHGNFHSDQSHECPQCSKTYRYKNNLRRHLRQSHRSVTHSPES